MSTKWRLKGQTTTTGLNQGVAISAAVRSHNCPLQRTDNIDMFLFVFLGKRRFLASCWSPVRHTAWRAGEVRPRLFAPMAPPMQERCCLHLSHTRPGRSAEKPEVWADGHGPSRLPPPTSNTKMLVAMQIMCKPTAAVRVQPNIIGPCWRGVTTTTTPIAGRPPGPGARDYNGPLPEQVFLSGSFPAIFVGLLSGDPGMNLAPAAKSPATKSVSRTFGERAGKRHEP